MWSVRHRNRNADTALAESVPLTCVPLYEGIEPSSLVAVALKIGGKGGIRTPGGFYTPFAFQASDLNHSSTLPNDAALMTVYK